MTICAYPETCRGRKRPAEKRLILCRTVPVSGNYIPFSGPSDMFSGDLVMDGPEMGEYLADKYKLITV